MPKIKTRKSLLKRIKVAHDGSLQRRHRQTSHLRSGESVATHRRKGQLTNFSKAFEKKIKILLAL